MVNKLSRHFLLLLILLTLKTNAQLSLINIDTLDRVKTRFDKHLNDTSGILFLTGELHGVSSNQKAEFHFIQFLTQYKNVKTILIEGGYTNSYLLNKYLKTGDTSFLNLYVSDYPSKYLEDKLFFVSLKSVYDNIASNRKFNIIAVDIVENDRQPYCFNLLNLLADKEISNRNLRNEIISLNNKDTFPNNIQSIQRLLTSYKANVDYSSDFDSICRSYQYWLDNKKNLWENRDLYLFEKVLSLSPHFKGNIYGHFGYGHIDIRGKCMAYYLIRDNHFKDKILPIYPYYYNCQSSFFDLKKSEGYYGIVFKPKLKKLKLPKGIYLTNLKGRDYLLHVDNKEMTELK